MSQPSQQPFLIPPTQLQAWKTRRSHWEIDRPWCRLRRDEVDLPNGQQIDDFYLFVRPDIALVLPVTPDDRVIFVRQYRHGVERILLELPAGRVDPGEDPKVAAARELREETGYTSDPLEPIVTLYDNPVKTTHSTHIFLARNAIATHPQTLDLTEEIEVILIPTSELWPCLQRGEIGVAGSVAAVLWWLHSRSTID
ncbi:MAG: NUDIX hydrolase [Oscillatoriales cyanobacterium]|jgi:ADP-ribose pyrophosphatase|nr:MAG: NUDIX hydrolase [Oscillatoriales cyanobacterium]